MAVNKVVKMKKKAVTTPVSAPLPRVQVMDMEVVPSAKEEKVEEKQSSVVLKKRACGCCEVNPVKLPIGQRYFEAPDGHLIVGEEDRQQVTDRRLNNGKGGWINPMR